ncbi:MAG: hypothetical protein HYZ91_06115 [Candidatus Omnitrophica bacterium]|nr:hypothetical protein [Candidatus Omnitrophota bacterium]
MITLVRRILEVFERHKLWDEGVELIGSWCFYLYQRHLGVKPYPLKTQDIDFLLPYPYRGHAQVDLIHELEALGFRHDFRPDGSIYLWNAELRIEFMIPERGRGMDKAPAIKSLGVRAMPLRFVDLLLRHPISIDEGGVQVLLPDPAAFCLHKLLIAARRKRPESRLKDFEQALHVIPIIRPATLRRIYAELPKTWQRGVLQSLERAAHSVPLLKDDATRLADTLQKFLADKK